MSPEPAGATPLDGTPAGATPLDGTPAGATLADLVEARVAGAPDATAVMGMHRSLTYGQLDVEANRLARHLQALGVGPEWRVGICLRRSPELVVAALATLKAGGACVPLDPSYPQGRLAAMVDDAGIAVLVTDEALEDRLPTAARVVRVDADAARIAPLASERPVRHVAGDGLAYVLYTSGSTGEPKGVMLTHRSLVGHVRAMVDLFALEPSDRALQFCSIGFDVSLEELYPTLAAGAAVVLRPDDAPLLGAAWLEWLAGREVTVLNLPTAYWHEWVQDLISRGEQIPPTVRLTIVGGEAPLGRAYRLWLEAGGDRARWLNAYGPAEATVTATAYEADGALEARDPPIGRPVGHARVRLLDERFEPVPEGEPGELVVGGPGVARGYLGRPDLTAASFVPDPFADEPGARMYRTGDLVRRLPSGDIEFLGRLDHQVKVRGFRVETDAVAAAVAGHPGVAEAVVVVREDSPGERRLVAYVTTAAAAEPVGPGDLRRFLSARLPDHMVPSAFVRLDALPQTANGKVDRDALPAPPRTRPEIAGPWAAPATPDEVTVAAIWTQVLRLDGLGVHDDFFELGGHSLLATQVVTRLREATGQDVPLEAIFRAPTVAGLATVVAGLRGGDGGPPPLVRRAGPPGEPAPLSVSQAQMHQLELHADPPGLYNVTVQHRFAGDASPAAVAAGLRRLVERHETLRTRVVGEGGAAHQVVLPDAPVDLAVSDLGGVPADEREATLVRRVAEQDAVPFDLATAPLFRAHLYRLGDQGCELAVTFDHLICDMTSAYIFLEEVAAAYDAEVEGRELHLPPLAVQYADFAAWQRAWLTDGRLAVQFDYWREKLAGMPVSPALPFDHVPEAPTRRVAGHSFSVPPEVYDPLSRLARACHATTFVACVAGFSALLSRAGGRDDVMLSTTLNGRQRNELDGLIGMFAGMARIRTDLSGDPTFTEIFDRARSSVLGLFEHQDIPFMQMRRQLFPDFPTSSDPVAIASAVPVELLYFHASHDHWAPGSAVVERPGSDAGVDRIFFRGQLQPLSLTFLDDGSRLWGRFSYKLDYFDDHTVEALAAGLTRLLAAVADDPTLRLSELPVALPARAAEPNR